MKPFLLPFFALGLAAQEAPLPTPAPAPDQAPKTPSCSREPVTITTVLDNETIRHSGARDLADLLSLLPSFHLGMDVQGSVGLGVRGLWGYEGRTLVLVDGVAMTDQLYGNFQPLNHIPVDLIEKVEVVHGPGPASNGGEAELAVIRVSTWGASSLARDPQDRDLGAWPEGKGIRLPAVQRSVGGQVSLAAGTAGRSAPRRTGSFSLGGRSQAGDFSWVVNAGAQEAGAGRGLYADFGGGVADLNRASTLRNVFASGALSLGGYRLGFLSDRNSWETRDGEARAYPDAEIYRTDTYALSLDKDFQLAEGLTLSPAIAWTRNEPWKTDARGLQGKDTLFPLDQAQRKRSDSLDMGVALAWKPCPYTLFRVALGRSTQELRALDVGKGAATFANGKDHAFSLSSSATLVMEFYTPAGAFNVGTRYSLTASNSDNVVPRLGWSRSFGRFKARLGVAQANPGAFFEAGFLARKGMDVVNEKATLYEGAFSYTYSRDGELSLNLFDTRIHNPILFVGLHRSGEGWQETYANGEDIGTRGLEAQASHRFGDLRLILSYAYYQNRKFYQETRPRLDVAQGICQVPGHGNTLLGFPRNKASLQALWRISPRWTLGGRLAYLGERYGFVWNPGAAPSGETGSRFALERFGGTPLLDAHLEYESSFGLRASLGLYNMLRREFQYLPSCQALVQDAGGQVTAYEPYHAPLRGQAPEAVLKVAYRF